MAEPGEPPFTVLVFDMARTGEPDGEHVVRGFETLDAATSYAIARVRASVEELRKPGIAAAELRQLWHIHGEDCSVLNANVRGSDLLDEFIATPATPDECNWQVLVPRQRRFRASLLISNDKDESVWAGGFFHSACKLSRDGLLDRFRDDAIGFVCHDVKFGGDASGVFAWPDEPTDWALRTMQFLLMADMMAMRGDGPDWANDCDVLSVKVTESDATPDYPLD